MAAKPAKLGAFGGMHTAGIFSDMTVDGPVIGTLVVIMDRAKNLPNRRSMGKQDPYCAARLGKEAKKTTTDRRGGQTPKWDQELRFTVHDSADYHQLKVSVFNDDKKTELIGETWVSLEAILLPGGGQSDGWHGLNCKGKYAGEVRIELTYYDSRPKVEKPVAEKKPVSSRAETGSPAIGGPRESTPIKRRPLPSDPTGASPSPAGTPDPRGLSGPQSGPRAYGTPSQPRTAEHTPISHRATHHTDAPPPRRPLPHASPLSGTPVSNHHSPQYQRGSYPEHDGRSPSPIPPLSNTPQYNEDGFDMSYTAPKPYEVPSEDSMPQHARAMSQDNFRHSHGHSHIELPHSHSAPAVPTQHSDPYSNGYAQHPDSYAHDPYVEPPYHVEPLRMSRNSDRGYDQGTSHDLHHTSNPYSDPSHDPFMSHGRSPGSMQPTVEDEDDIPPPPPVHRSSATSVSQQPPNHLPNYHNDAPAPLNINRYREDPQHAGYDSPPQGYGMNDYSAPPSQERRYTHPRPLSRPVSRDVMAPSMLRNETAAIPSSLVPGFDGSRQDARASHAAPSYETPPRPRQYSEPDHRASQHYETSPHAHQLPPHHSFPTTSSPSYYPHDAPEQPRRTSPVHETALVRPHAISPGASPSPADGRASRAPTRAMPTRKSVSPRPPPSTVDDGEQKLSAVPFNPDSFDVYNPIATKKNPSGTPGKSDNTGADNVEINEKGQVVTFSGRVIDASDHLPLDSWAPEPETKGAKKDRPVRERPVLSGARDLEAARERERSYRQQRLERERIRNAVHSVASDTGSPSNALVSSRHQYGSANGSAMSGGAMVLHDHESTTPGSGGRNRLQKRNARPMSSYTPPSNASPGHIPSSNSNVLRERENIGGYGSSPGYGTAGSRHSVAAPPIPAKIPLDGNIPSEDMTALSMELSTIDIGPGSGGRARATTRRRFGAY